MSNEENVMLKEKGYDEFLAEKIRKGEDDLKHGRVLSAEQSRAEARQAIQRKMQELEHAQSNGFAYA